MRRVRPLAVLFALALVAGDAGLAQALQTSPLGTDGHGVRIVQRGRPAHLVVLLSATRYRAVAGKELVMVCAPAPQATLGGVVLTRPHSGPRRIPRPPGGVVARLHPPHDRAPLATHLRPGWDWCAMDVRTFSDHGRSISDRGFATVPLTPAGAAFADERQVALTVIVTAEFLSLSKRWAAHPQRLARRLHAVALASPAELPPPGRLGLYSAGIRHVYAAQSDRAGDLLFLELDGDTMRTNLLRYLQDDALWWGAKPFR